MSQSAFTDHDVLMPSPQQPGTTPVNAPRRSVALWHWLRKSLPTVAVVGGLAGLAIWGHSSDWTMPKFSSLTGNGGTQIDDWCKEHSVPESQCIECNKNLISPGKDYGWCKEHGVAQCPLHHPDVAQLKEIPTVTSEDIDRASRALALRPRPENNSRCKLHQRHIQFASIQSIEKVGIDISVAQKRAIFEAVNANGEVIYDQTHTAHLSSRVAGSVWRVEKQVGDRVRKGDVLALIDAADVGRAKSEFLAAIAQLRLKQGDVERLRPLAKDGGIAGKILREAETANEEARIRLKGAQQALINLGLPVQADKFADVDTDEIDRRIQFLGVPTDLVSHFDAASTTSNLFPLRSPLDGIVVNRKAAPGEVVDVSSAIFSVADVRRMWLMLDVRQEDARLLSLGQTVLFRPSDNKDGAEIRGSLSWISTSADEQTRTVKVRVDLPNTDGQLWANTFGAGRIVLRQEPSAVVVPSDAVHWDGCCNVVFVRDRGFLREGAPKFFHIRKVRLGVKDRNITEIIAGLLPGEVVASKNSVVLEAELLKGNLGAGCCEACAPKKK